MVNRKSKSRQSRQQAVSIPDSRFPIPCCLTIAGSDSGGGAGIQADLKTFAALGVHGTSAITALTAQNTRGVTAVHTIPIKHLRAELDAVFDDFAVAAVKTGMLGDARTVCCVARELRNRELQRPCAPTLAPLSQGGSPSVARQRTGGGCGGMRSLNQAGDCKTPQGPSLFLVVDPVMIATSGARLLDADAARVLIDYLVPLADVLTPNLPEAEVLTGLKIGDARGAARAGNALRDMGAKAVLLKGGHGHGREVIDRWFDARGTFEIRNRRLPFDAHGTGCTLSAALAAELALGRAPRAAARHAVAFVQRALAHAYVPGTTPLRVLAQRAR